MPGSVSEYVLESFGLGPESIRSEVERIVGKGTEVFKGQIPFTPRAKKVLELALREALSMGDSYIGTNHIVLGLVREDEGVAGAILRGLDISGDKLRDAVGVTRSAPVGERERDDALAEIAGRKPRRTSTGKNKPENTDPPAAQQSQSEAEPNAELDEAVEAVPTLSDRPATEDDLGRYRLAAVLGERIRRARNEQTDVLVKTLRQRRRKLASDKASTRAAGSFLVHIHAPWGAGKSSLLNFLADDLRNRRDHEAGPETFLRRVWGRLVCPRAPANPNLSRWIVVEFSAWEHQRLVAPWWWLLSSIQRACARELWRINRGRWLWFLTRDVAWRLWNARAAVLTILILSGIALAAWAEDWFGLPDQSLSAVRAAALTLTAALAVAGTVFGLVRGSSKWLAIGSAEGAIRFLKRSHDPLGIYRRRFRWLVKSSGRPITVFIDDLDRCRPDYVVELLEGIQTLFADAPVTYVVAADRAWLCESFAHAYSEFEDAVGEPGRPLGFLFLEKTFQISLEIPPMSNAERSHYWNRLMRASKNGGGHPKRPPQRDLGKALANASTQAEVETSVEALMEEGADADDALQAGVRRLNAPDMEGQLETLLSEFAPLLENNPRSMKRLMNAYGIERDRLLREGYILTKAERRQLALLTILRLRWPLFADHLRLSPSDIAYCDGSRSAPDEHVYIDLFGNREMCRLFDGSHVPEQLDISLLTEFPARKLQ